MDNYKKELILKNMEEAKNKIKFYAPDILSSESLEVVVLNAKLLKLLEKEKRD